MHPVESNIYQLKIWKREIENPFLNTVNAMELEELQGSSRVGL